MARTSIREFFRSKNPFFSSPSVIPSNPTKFHLSCYSSSSSSSSSSNFTSGYTISSFLPLQKCQNMRQLFQVQAHLIIAGFCQDPFPASRILKFCADLGDIDYTILIFRHIDFPDTFCVNTVIKAYSRSHVAHQALVFYFEMLRDGFFPNSFTFPPLVNSCAKINSSAAGGKCHGQAIKNGADHVVPVQNSLINMYACYGLNNLARGLFDEMSQRDLVSWNSIMDGYVKLGDMGIAGKLFDEMPERNVISWNIMIGGYLKDGNPGCALKLFRNMVKIGLRGSDTTMVSVLTACARSARLKEGKSVHASLIRSLVRTSLILNTALISMYSRCQRVEDAQRLFDGTLERNLVCWNAMILGHCIHGCPEDGLTMFADMVGRKGSEDERREHDQSKNMQVEGKGPLPDEVTFIGVLCACARARLLSEGKIYFNQMTNVYNLKPKFAHYWCMANIYARVGLVREAEEVLRSMTEEDKDWTSEALVWADLLGSCRFRGDVNLGERIAKHLIELEPQNASQYVLLLNVYAVAGQWEEVAKVKVMMKERGLGRTPGSSLVDLNETVHKFKVGDKSKNGMEVYTMMDALAERLRLLKETGSRPDEILIVRLFYSLLGRVYEILKRIF